MGLPNLGIALGASADEFNNQRRMAREDERFRLERDRMIAEEQDRQKAREAADQYSSSIQDAGTMAGLPGQLRERVAKGELSQDEANNALAAYRSAGYDPTSLRKKATLGLAAIDPGKAALVQKALHDQARADLMGELSPLLLKKDYAGIAKRMSDNSFYSDGNEYHFTGQAKDKDGRNHVGFAIKDAKGNVVGQPMAVAEEDFPAFVEASIDPTKGVEYSRILAAERKADKQFELLTKKADQQHADNTKRLDIALARANASGGGGRSGRLDSPMSLQNFGLRLTNQMERESRNDPVAYGVSSRINNAISDQLKSFKPGADAEMIAIGAEKTRNDIIDKYRTTVGEFAKYRNYLEGEDLTDPKSFEANLSQSVANRVKEGWSDAEIRHATAIAGLTQPGKAEKGGDQPKITPAVAAKNALIVDRALAAARAPQSPGLGQAATTKPSVPISAFNQ